MSQQQQKHIKYIKKRVTLNVLNRIELSEVEPPELHFAEGPFTDGLPQDVMPQGLVAHGVRASPHDSRKSHVFDTSFHQTSRS